MLRLQLHYDPHGDVTARRTLGTLCVANDGTGTREHGNYRVWLENEHGARFARAGLHGMPRRHMHAWALVLEALQALGADEIQQDYDVDTPAVADVVVVLASEDA